ncbi:MAG: 5-formyltetrahydrofolate cyclo-ligase [Methyloceanibacter sp.]
MSFRQIGKCTRGARRHESALSPERFKLEPSARRFFSNEIARHLLPFLTPLAGRIVSLYWPIRAEPDLRSLASAIRAGGAACALPVVVEKQAPMVFRLWEPGMNLVPGIWNIPAPPDGSPVTPDVVVAPVVGYDRACFRLGYGGGYFDRTLVRLRNRPLAVGVGYAQSELPTIYPFPHDIPLDGVVTERGVLKSVH